MAAQPRRMAASGAIDPAGEGTHQPVRLRPGPKAALAGRLMIRKLVAEKLNIPWGNIRLQRTAKGKPVLAKDSLNPYPNFNFNISHQGDYAVLAAESELQVGIDIMKTSFPGNVAFL